MGAPLEHWVPVMFEDPGQILDIARIAEETGFTGIALADHVAIPLDFHSVHGSGHNPFDPRTPFYDPVATAAAAASVTTRLRIMTYVLVVTMRDPFTVAKQAGTLSVLSGGRFALGVGAGWLVEEIAVLGHDRRDRGSRMDEYLEVIQAFLRDGVVEYHGKHVDFGPTAMFPTPPEPPPIWVGGKAAPALARAALYDGWLGMDYPYDDMMAQLDRIQDLRRRRADEVGPPARPPQTLVVTVPPPAPSPDLHHRLADRGVTATIATPWYPGDPAHADLEAKRSAMWAWSERYGLL
ncbi:MAG TPA: TIGR03619 family F420-dependent LLM class oxidoreductase [Acidimicrobiales bacterium]